VKPAPTAVRPLQVSAGARTDRGRRRTVNEDAFLAEYPVFVVADGMGGHEAGDLAAAAVVDAFRPLVGRDDLAPAHVTEAVRAAHRTVAALASSTRRGAGSTLAGVVAVSHGDVRRWLVINVGDSRVYRLLSNRLDQLTVDHSVAQELVEQGRLARDEVAEYRGRNVITRAVGDDQSEADYWLLPVVTGERLLVCSDGLSGELPDEALRAGLTLGGSTEQTAHTLVDHAVERGGRDNITAVVVDVLAGGITPRTDDVTGIASFSSSFSRAAPAPAAVPLDDADTVPGRRRGSRRG
jgi:PPM family protein phosphatase